MTETSTRFFPDTNIILALILREQRYLSSNILFSEQVEQNRLSCTILPSIEDEFRRKLDETIDLADELLTWFIAEVSMIKSDVRDVWKPVKLGRGDIRLIERSFSQLYAKIESVPNPKERAKMKAVYDLIEAWIMGFWSQHLKENHEINLDDFFVSLRSTVSDGRSILEDGFMGLKKRLNHVDCDWSQDASVEGTVSELVSDPDDVPHVGMAATYAKNDGGRAIYVTNDNEILRASEPLLMQFKLVVSRPAFAYAFSLDS